MRSQTWTWGLLFWLVGALCVLLPAIAGAASRATDAAAGSQRSCLLLTSYQPQDSSTDADSESGERAALCSLPSVLRTSPGASSVENAAARVDDGTRATRQFPLVYRFAPRPPPAPSAL